MLSMTILGLIVLTLRAAFYNPVIRGRRGKRREKEFEDYKLYMSKFYDTANWDLDWIPEVVAEKKDENSCLETDSTSGEAMPDSFDVDDDHSNPILVQSIVSSHDGSAVLNLAIPANDAAGHIAECMENEEDSDYDSTYSCASDDDIRSMSSSSVFSIIFQKLKADRNRLHTHDLPHVQSSSSSIMSRFMPHKTPQSMRSSTNQSFLSTSEQSMVSTSSSNGRGGSSPEIRYAQHTNALHLNNGFSQESDSDDADDSIDVDSLAGVLMTPPELRYSASRRADLSRALHSRVRVKDDPDGFELEPLSPSPQHNNARSRKNSVRKYF